LGPCPMRVSTSSEFFGKTLAWRLSCNVSAISFYSSGRP
jgi:hypothetical protein